MHPGVDIAVPVDTPVTAADTGVVLYAGWGNNGEGLAVVVDHGNGWQTFYAHLNSVAVSCGAGVAQGDFLGKAGSTGNSTGPHLHFELFSLREGSVNPLDYLPFALLETKP